MENGDRTLPTMEREGGVAQPGAVTLAVAQLDCDLRDMSANADRIAEAARAAAADILLTPELSLTGYDVRDAVHRLARPVEPGDPPPVAALADLPGDVIIGLVEAAQGGPFNTAAAIRGGRIAFRQRKLYLPTYGMFDEGRWFGRGRALETWSTAGGWHAGVLVCEDFWHPGLAYVLASRGVDLLLVVAAAPGRGVWEGGERGAFASADVWERIARTTAQLYGVYVALCNRAGVEGGITFAGGSMIVGPDGAVLARAEDATVETITVELVPEALARARRPYAHVRDDDPGLIVRELERRPVSR